MGVKSTTKEDMDYMVYKHDQLSLLDMIEVESAQFENWYTGSREIETETKHFSLGGDQVNSTKCVNESLFDEFVRLESLRGNVLSNINVHTMETDWLEKEECMNWEPHLLVNPRTGAPINAGDPDDVIGGLQTTNESAYSVIPMSDLTVKRQLKEDTKTPSQPIQTFTTFTLGDAQITNSSNSVALQPQLISTQPNTVQVYLQVTNAVGGMIPSDGTLCLIKMESEDEQSAQTGDNTPGVQPVEDSDDAAEGNETFEKPVFSYSCLIAMALKNSDTGSLPVNEIYAYILDKFPYFRTAPDGWKNSIRHNLSLNKCFEKIENPTVNGSSRKGCLWGLNPAKVDKMDDEIAKWIKRASKSNLSVSSADGNLLSSNVASGNGDLHVTVQPSTPTLLSSSFWDDETDELMSSAMSFGARRVLPKGARAHVVPDKDSRQPPLVTCRSYHIKTTSTQSTNHANVLTSPVTVVAKQAAIG